MHFERHRKADGYGWKVGDVAEVRDGGDPGAGEIFERQAPLTEKRFLQGGGIRRAL